MAERYQETEPSARKAREASESERNPQEGNRSIGFGPSGGLAGSEKENRSTARAKVEFGWDVTTPAEALVVLAQRVESVRRYVDAEHSKTLYLWDGLTALHLLIDQIEVMMLAQISPSEFRDPRVPGPRSHRQPV